jgi:hypothetical protein
MFIPLTATLIERSIITENFMTLSFTVSEKMEKQVLNISIVYLITGSDIFKSVERYSRDF